MMVLGISMLITGTALNAIVQSFSLSLFQAGLIVFAMSLGFTISSSLSGILSDIKGKRLTILAGLAFLSIFLILVGISTSFSSYLVCVALMGASWGLIQAPTNALLIDLYSQRSGPILNLSYLFFGSGCMLAPLIVGYILSNYASWRFIYRCVAIFPLGCFFLLAVQGPIAIIKQPKQSSGLKYTTKMTALLITKSFVLLGLSAALYMGSEVVVMSWLCMYLQRIHSFPLTKAAGALSLFQLMMIVGRLLCARISLQLRDSRLVLILILGSIIFIVTATILKIASLVTLTWALSGLFFSGIMPALLSYGNFKFPQCSGKVMGLLTSFAGVGGMIFPILIGIVADRAGLRFAMSVPAVLLSLAFVILVSLIRADSFGYD